MRELGQCILHWMTSSSRTGFWHFYRSIKWVMRWESGLALLGAQNFLDCLTPASVQHIVSQDCLAHAFSHWTYNYFLYKNHYVNRCIEGLKNRNLFRKTSTVSTADRKKVAEMICDYLWLRLISENIFNFLWTHEKMLGATHQPSSLIKVWTNKHTNARHKTIPAHSIKQ